WLTPFPASLFRKNRYNSRPWGRPWNLRGRPLLFPGLQVLPMVTIRLSRGGSKKRPFYHMLVTDSRSRRDGRYIERLGYYNPDAKGGEIPLSINQERVEYWLSQG